MPAVIRERGEYSDYSCAVVVTTADMASAEKFADLCNRVVADVVAAIGGGQGEDALRVLWDELPDRRFAEQADPDDMGWFYRPTWSAVDVPLWGGR